MEGLRHPQVSRRSLLRDAVWFFIAIAAAFCRRSDGCLQSFFDFRNDLRRSLHFQAFPFCKLQDLCATVGEAFHNRFRLRWDGFESDRHGLVYVDFARDRYMAISSFQAMAFNGTLIRKIRLVLVSGQSFMVVLYLVSPMIADFLTQHDKIFGRNLGNAARVSRD